MAYNPVTDFLALFRQTSNGVRGERAPTLDVVLSTLARAGLFNMVVSQTAPTAAQTTTAWFVPASQSWAAEGSLFLWNANTNAYEPATPALFFRFLQAAGV